MISASRALARLRAGNHRFVSDMGRDTLSHEARRRELVEGQAPFAVVLGCADSRVPAETVFDQTLGDLFVVRVAGNVAAPSQVGSVEFAVERFGTRLVVVLGHSRCGAVQATLEALESEPGELSEGLRSIVERVRPSVEPLWRTELRGDPGALVARAVRDNIRAAAAELRTQIRTEGVEIVGAEYALETGVVDFFDGVPGAQEDS